MHEKNLFLFRKYAAPGTAIVVIDAPHVFCERSMQKLVNGLPHVLCRSPILASLSFARVSTEAQLLSNILIRVKAEYYDTERGNLGVIRRIH